jgi:hypothetical protein
MVDWQFTTADARVKLKKLYPWFSCKEPLVPQGRKGYPVLG